MDAPLVVSILAAAAAIVVPLLARRDLLTKLQTQEEAREESRKEWREAVNVKLSAIEQRKESSEIASMQAMDREREKAWWVWRSSIDKELGQVTGDHQRIMQAEMFINELREWKHVRGEPHVNAMIALEQRVARIERVLNGKLS